MSTANQSYRVRMERVLDYIDEHLDECPTPEELSRIAHFSVYHFHRQFSSYAGVSVSRYQQLMRLKRAAFQLAYRRELRVIDIALGAGFDSPEAFSRAFRKVFDQSPSEFRRSPGRGLAQERFEALNSVRAGRRNVADQNTGVSIVDFESARVAALEHLGPPEGLPQSLRTFIEWRRCSGRPPAASRTYNILYADPAEVKPEEYRLDICATIDTDVGDNPQGVVARVIPGGRCARLRHTGNDETIGARIDYLYSDWLPDSGERLRDFPCFLQRVTLFPDVPEHRMITDIYLPLADQ